MRQDFKVCPVCSGKGTIVNPAVDGNGLSAEDFEEQGPDFKEDYLSGVYDVSCPRCQGIRVIDRYAELRTIRFDCQRWKDTCHVHSCNKPAFYYYTYAYSEYPGAHIWPEHVFTCKEHTPEDIIAEYKAYDLIEEIPASQLSEEEQEALMLSDEIDARGYTLDDVMTSQTRGYF